MVNRKTIYRLIQGHLPPPEPSQLDVQLACDLLNEWYTVSAADPARKEGLAGLNYRLWGTVGVMAALAISCGLYLLNSIDLSWFITLLPCSLLPAMVVTSVKMVCDGLKVEAAARKWIVERADPRMISKYVVNAMIDYDWALSKAYASFEKDQVSVQSVPA